MAIINDKPITQELMLCNTLVFKPKDGVEFDDLIAKLENEFDVQMDPSLVKRKQSSLRIKYEAVEGAILVYSMTHKKQSGLFWTLLDSVPQHGSSLFCTYAQFNPRYIAPGGMQDQFNKLSTRVTKLERKIDNLIEALDKKATSTPIRKDM